MFSKALLVIGIVVSVVNGCKFFCKNPETAQYECCDGGNPYFKITEPIVEPTAEISSDAETIIPDGLTSGCYYYCANLAGEAYCCGDITQPLPENHDDHEGKCAKVKETVCKSDGLFLNAIKTKIQNGKGALLVKNDQEIPACASDGYCATEDKCCWNICAKKHTCMKSVDSKN